MKPLHLSSVHSKVALSIKVSALLLIVLALYHQDLALIANEALHSEIMSYMLAIPILFTYLIYRKRKLLRATITFQPATPNKKPTYTNHILGALLCLTAFLLYWHGSYTFHPLEHHLISLPIFTAGITLIIFNTATLRALAFPTALLTFLTPPPQETLTAIGTTLSTTSSQTAYTILKLLGLPVTLTTQYGTPIITLTKPNTTPIPFTIDPACAGFYSLIGFIIFATFTAHITKTKLPKKAAIFLIGIPLMLTLNITRIIIIVLIGNQYGKETALQAFHLLGGWILILTGSIILATITEKIFKIPLFTTKQKLPPCNYCKPNPNPNPKQHFCPACGKPTNPPKIKLTKQDIYKILILTLTATLILNIQVPVFALTEGPAKLNIRTLSGEETTTQMLPQMPDYTTMFYYRDKTFEEYTKQDASLIYAYYSNDTTKKTVWTIIEIAKTKASMHPWEVCLITWRIAQGHEPVIRQSSQRDIHLLENPPITARYFSFQDIKTNLTQVILYWYESSYFNTGSSLEREYTKISFVAYATSPEEIPSVEDQLLPFGKAMIDHWLPIKSWSLVALLISQNGTTLIAITTTLLAITLAYQTIKNKKQKTLNFKAYNKLVSQEEKLLIQAANEAAKERKPTGNAIAQTYQKLAQKPAKPSLLFQKLNKAEEAGFITREIANQDDEPIIIWKTQISFPKPPKLQNLTRKFLRLPFHRNKLKTNLTHNKRSSEATKHDKPN